MQITRSLFCLAVAGILSVSTCLTAAAQQKNIVETAVGAGNFNTLVAAVKAAGLVDALSAPGQLTVFAPTDDAFAKLDPALLQSLLQPENKSKLASILTYHVVPGRVSAADAYDLRSAASLQGQRLKIDFQAATPMINESNLVATDIGCTNGVIHVIDTVMLPALDTIPTTAVNAGTFNTLVAAVGAADLGGVLSGPGPFTVFAPTDDAFAALPAGTVETLLQPENKQKLIDVLKYHVVSGRVYDNDAVKARNAATLLGPSVSIKFSAEGVMIDDAKVVAKNINASNGVIHVIDKVLLPVMSANTGSVSAVSPAHAMSMVSGVIDQGAPIFNAGHHGQCGQLYSATMNQLLTTGIAGCDSNTMSMISNTLSSAGEIQNDTERAWALRRGLDSVYSRLSQMQ